MLTTHTTSEIIDSVINPEQTVLAADLDIVDGAHTVLVLKNGSQSILVQVSKDMTLEIVNSKYLNAYGVKPRSAEQVAYMHYLMNDAIPLVVAVGRAGTGKTFLSMAVALDKVLNAQGPQDTIVLCKGLSEIGPHRIGTVPGDIRDKLEPYIEAYKFCMKKLLGGYDSGAVISRYEEREVIQYKPINVLRGITLENAIVIIDEAQNLDIDTVRALGTRIGQGSRLFLLGDLTQTDEELNNSGLECLMTHPQIKQSPLSAAIELVRNERSPLSELLDKILS